MEEIHKIIDYRNNLPSAAGLCKTEGCLAPAVTPDGRCGACFERDIIWALVPDALIWDYVPDKGWEIRDDRLPAAIRVYIKVEVER